jgi:P27 family predicted phage terminase small subunit
MGARGPISNRGKDAPVRRRNAKPELAVVEDLDEHRSLPAAPDGLGEEGRQAWDEAVSECAWLADRSDSRLLAWYCELVDEREQLKELIGESGRTTRGSQGQTVSHPLVDQLRALEQQALRLASALGLGPAHKARLGVAVATMRDREEATKRKKTDAIMATYRRAAQ